MYGRTKSLEGRLTQEVLPKKKEILGGAKEAF